jgi:formate-dependent nitrite reductase membrane component NrfD
MNDARKLLADPTFGAERAGDGRNVDRDVGTLLGEGAEQRVKELRSHPAPPERALGEDARSGPTYYGLPVLKAPVWTWEIPAYFFTGGLAGACGVLGAAAQVAGGPAMRPLVRRCRLVAAGGAIASAALLIDDLGRPSRFLNMLRVFRPTSPMNMGTWVLSGFGACSGAAAASAVLPLPRPLRALADGAGIAAGVLGLPLVGYTGVLLANTAVPIWQGTRRSLPVLFAFSGAASAGALLEVWPPRGPGAAVARRLGVLSTTMELVFSIATEAEAALVPRVARPLRRGPSGALFRAGQVLAATSLGMALQAPRGVRGILRRGRKSRLHAISGVLGILGTLAIRFGIAAAGRVSARDPLATFRQQRAGMGAREVLPERGEPRMPTLPGVEPTGKDTSQHGLSP